MKIKLMASCFLIGALMAPFVGYTADSDTDRSHPKAFVKDSVITTKIKSKLAAENLDSTMYIRVDTDSDGVVWLSGTAKTQAEIDKTVSIARGTEGVKSVENHIKIK
jgi:hyperosmotically inducible protein